MEYIVITNNQLVLEKYRDGLSVEFVNGSYKDVLVNARDKIHVGHILLSHPLSGSVKPDETPYKSLLVSKKADVLDTKSLSIIESAIETCDKFGPCKYKLTPQLEDDFAVIDFSLITSAIQK